jgi:hypothetical protein
MNRFFGYGSWNAKLWFVGMEEGGVGKADPHRTCRRELPD